MRTLNCSNLSMRSGSTSCMTLETFEILVCTSGMLTLLECGSREMTCSPGTSESMYCLESEGIGILGLSQESVRVVGAHARLHSGIIGSFGRHWRQVSTGDARSDSSDLFLEGLHCVRNKAEMWGKHLEVVNHYFNGHHSTRATSRDQVLFLFHFIVHAHFKSWACCHPYVRPTQINFSIKHPVWWWLSCSDTYIILGFCFNAHPPRHDPSTTCQDLASITQSELMRQVNDNSKNGECTSYRPVTYTTIHVVSSLCTWGIIS